MTRSTPRTRPVDGDGAVLPRLPPGSRLPDAVQTAMLLRDPTGYLRACRRRHGDVFRCGFVGVPGLVYVAEPELARRVFATDRDIGRAGEVRRSFLEPVVGPNSLLCLDGEEWVRQRRFLGSAFHSKRIEGYRDQIAAIAADHVRTWPVGVPLRLRPRMEAITLEVILRVVFGVRDDERVERLRQALPRLTAAMESVDTLAFMLPEPVWTRVRKTVSRVPGNPVARFVALQNEVDGLLYDEISRRREAHDACDRTDILSVLLRARDQDGTALTDAEVRDGLMTLLLAGHETTATALAWAFERLVRHQAVLGRLSDTIDDGADDYLDAVIKETLRTRPIVVDMPRVLTEPLDLAGHHVPAGWWVSPAAPLLHDSAAHFPQPEAFRPERFLGDDAALHAWIPFGGGRRQCLGSQFALLEMRVVIPEVLTRLRVRVAANDHPERVRTRHVTLAPARDGLVVAEPR